MARGLPLFTFVMLLSAQLEAAPTWAFDYEGVYKNAFKIPVDYTVTFATIERRFGQPQRVVEQVVRYHFGTNGKIESETTYYPEKNAESVLRYEYDREDRPITKYYALADGSMMISESFTYEPGRTLEKEFGLSNDLISATETLFDVQGRKVEWTDYDKEGKASIKTITVYAAGGKREMTYDENGALYERREYAFTGDQLTSQTIFKTSSGKEVLSFVITYGYNADGTLASEVTKNAAKQQISRHLYQYDGKAERTEDLFENQSGTSRTTYEYNDNGDLIKLGISEKSTKYGQENWDVNHEIDVAVGVQPEPRIEVDGVK